MRIKRIHTKGLHNRVRFYGQLPQGLPQPKDLPPQRVWYIDVIKETKKSNWRLFKTSNCETAGIYYPADDRHFKTLHEVQEWLFIERL